MKDARRHSGFTLIEILVVVTIVIILTGILFRGMAFVQNAKNRTRCITQLQSLANAIEEYYGEYGIYPPVSIVAYEYLSTSSNSIAGNFRAHICMYANREANPEVNINEAWADAARNDEGDDYIDNGVSRQPGDPGYNGQASWNLGYRYGLVAHLWPRQQYSASYWWHDYDTDRDAEAKERWSSFLADVGLSGSSRLYTNLVDSRVAGRWENSVRTVRDPWGQEIIYKSLSPYQSYELYSKGADKTAGTGDDITRDTR